MTTPTISRSEHILAAQALLDEADDEFAAGKLLKASEVLWGAVAHALIAIALSRGLPYDSHGALRRIASQLPGVPNQVPGKSEFGRAEELHLNFYHGQLTQSDCDRIRPMVRIFVERLLTVARQPDA